VCVCMLGSGVGTCVGGLGVNDYRGYYVIVIRD